jgi:hypothetical protein
MPEEANSSEGESLGPVRPAQHHVGSHLPLRVVRDLFADIGVAWGKTVACVWIAILAGGNYDHVHR